MKRALIVSGGWEGHQPSAFAEIFSRNLEQAEFEVTNETALECYDDGAALADYDLIVPNWTMGRMSHEQTTNLSNCIRRGTGLAGAHGGMGDSMRGNLLFEWMVGGQFLDHPYIGEYEVEVLAGEAGITDGLVGKHPYVSEQYYMMVDPAVDVLAHTTYRLPDQAEVTMPVAWTRRWGKGKVFYSALGHDPKEYAEFRFADSLLANGMLWAAR